MTSGAWQKRGFHQGCRYSASTFLKKATEGGAHSSKCRVRDVLHPSVYCDRNVKMPINHGRRVLRRGPLAGQGKELIGLICRKKRFLTSNTPVAMTAVTRKERAGSWGLTHEQLPKGTCSVVG